MIPLSKIPFLSWTDSDVELAALFQLSPQILCIAGTDGYFKRVNPAFEKILGHTAAELLAQPFVDLVHPADRPSTIQAVSTLASGSPVCHFENRYRCRDGSYRWLCWTAAPGGGDRIYAVALDVTERKAAEEATRRSEDRYRQLLEAMTTYTYTVQVQGGVARATAHSPGVEPVTGFAAEAYERDPSLWSRMIHPADRDAVQAHLDRMLSGGAVQSVEYRIRDARGAIRWIRDTIIPFCDAAGRVVRYDGAVQDITDRKEDEERFRLLVECAPDAIVVADSSGRIVHINRKTQTLFGYAKDELLGQSVELLIPQRLRGRHVEHRRAFAACPAGRAMGQRPDLACRRRDGSEFPAEISLSTLGSDGQTLVYSAIRDVTELRATQRRIHDSEVEQMAAWGIQQRLLPDGPPALAGFEIAGAYHPAAATSGDMYDYIPLADGALGLAIGDVAGHGLAAALLMASTHAYLRVLAASCSDVGEILARANALIVAETDASRFVTLLLGRLDTVTRTFTYCSAGHPTALVLNAAGEVRRELASTAPPLGIFPDEPFDAAGPVPLEEGDLLLLLTDGILEAIGPTDQQFGIGRLLEVLRAHRHEPAPDIVSALYRGVREFCGARVPHDDITLVIVKAGPPPG